MKIYYVVLEIVQISIVFKISQQPNMFEDIEFEDSNGVLVPTPCTWIGGEKLRKFLWDIYGPNGRNYQQISVNVCLDSGVGKFLVRASG